VELENLAVLGSTSVKELLNPKSTGFRALKLELAEIDDQEAAKLINHHPKIMRRPLLSDGKKLAIGFDPDQFQSITG
jgi:arsenate reductase-like glutaredoxin family protein